MMFIEGLKYPMGKENSGKVLAFGSLYVLLSIFIIPIFMLAGYMAHMIGEPSRNNRLPPIDSYGKLLGDGFKLSLVYLIYAIMAMIVGGGLMAVAMVFDSVAVMAMAFLIGLPLFIIFSILAYGGVVNFAKNGYRISEAFDLNAIKKFSFNGSFIIATLIVWIVFPIIQSVVVSLLSFTIIGLVLIPTVYLYTLMASGFVLSEGYEKSTN